MLSETHHTVKKGSCSQRLPPPMDTPVGNVIPKFPLKSQCLANLYGSYQDLKNSRAGKGRKHASLNYWQGDKMAQPLGKAIWVFPRLPVWKEGNDGMAGCVPLKLTLFPY